MQVAFLQEDPNSANSYFPNAPNTTVLSLFEYQTLLYVFFLQRILQGLTYAPTEYLHSMTLLVSVEFSVKSQIQSLRPSHIMPVTVSVLKVPSDLWPGGDNIPQFAKPCMLHQVTKSIFLHFYSEPGTELSSHPQSECCFVEINASHGKFFTLIFVYIICKSLLNFKMCTKVSRAKHGNVICSISTYCDMTLSLLVE